MATVLRVRRLSVHDEWPQCAICSNPFCVGYEICSEDYTPSFLCICDVCLRMSREVSPQSYDGQPSMEVTK